MGRIIGIDLGKRSACMTAVNEDGSFQTIFSEDGSEKFPFAAAVTELGEYFSGSRAQRYLRRHPEKELAVSALGAADMQTVYRLFFRELKKRAREVLREEVEGVLISTGMMDFQQMQILAQGAADAGFSVERILGRTEACTLSVVQSGIFQKNMETKFAVSIADSGILQTALVSYGSGVAEMLAWSEVACTHEPGSQAEAVKKGLRKVLEQTGCTFGKVSQLFVFCGESRGVVHLEELLKTAFGSKVRVLRVMQRHAAKGAAIQAGILEGNRHFRELLLLNLMKCFVGFRKKDGRVRKFLEAEVSIPVKKFADFSFHPAREGLQQELPGDILSDSGELHVVYGIGTQIRTLAQFRLKPEFLPGEKGLRLGIDVDAGRNITLIVKNLQNGREGQVRLLHLTNRVSQREFCESNTAQRMNAEQVLKKMLPVLDSLICGIRGLAPDERTSATGKGMLQTYQQFLDVFKEMNVVPIEAEGCLFDPYLHHAIEHEINGAYGTNWVLEEYQKGYLYHGKVLRPAMVKVVN